MYRRLLLKFCEWLLRLTYERVSLDGLNKKLIRPVEGLLINGVQYYEFVNLGDMPISRFVHYQHLRQELGMGVDRETANKYLEEMKIAVNNGDRSRNGALIYMLQDTINNCTPLEVLYLMAAIIYFDKDEDISCFDHDYNTAKIKLFKSQPNQTFFLRRLLTKGLKLAGEESLKDIEKYLMQSAVKLQAWRGILSGQSDKETSMTSSVT